MRDRTSSPAISKSVTAVLDHDHRSRLGPAEPPRPGDLRCARLAGMEILILVALYAIPLIIGWFVIYSAVLAALRRHDRERAAGR